MDQFENKVRVTIPEYIDEILNTDRYDFNISKNELCNKIFYAFHLTASDHHTHSKKQSSTMLQFTLNKDNFDFWIDHFPKQTIKNKSEYFRNIIFAYCNQPRYKREISLNQVSVERINKAIAEQKQLRIRYKNGLRIIEPYALLHSENETRNYIFAYCIKKQDYCNYRLANIEAVSIMDAPFEYYNKTLINGVKNNFDPFLSYGQIVKAKLTELGKNIYERNITHRPRLLKQDGDIYEFECSEIRAKLYFTQFLGEVEILEPSSLREWFKHGALAMAKIYTTSNKSIGN